MYTAIKNVFTLNYRDNVYNMPLSAAVVYNMVSVHYNCKLSYNVCFCKCAFAKDKNKESIKRWDNI